MSFRQVVCGYVSMWEIIRNLCAYFLSLCWVCNTMIKDLNFRSIIVYNTLKGLINTIRSKVIRSLSYLDKKLCCFVSLARRWICLAFDLLKSHATNYKPNIQIRAIYFRYERQWSFVEVKSSERERDIYIYI